VKIKLKILVDHRERHLTEFLEGVCEEVVFTQLPIGDYLVVSDSGGVLVERKTVTDFFSSVRSNRLWDQLLRMMKTERVLEYQVKRRILLIHGNFQDYFEPYYNESEQELLVHWSQLMGAYMEIIYVYNTPIIHAESDAAFKAFMKILVKREFSGKNDKLPDAKWYEKPVSADLPIMDRKKYILSSLPYIGDRLAENLLKHFNTISGVACASVEELQEVPKIGKKKAELIYTLFHS
jgi:DNA excision repair protein ERCC-4